MKGLHHFKTPDCAVLSEPDGLLLVWGNKYSILLLEDGTFLAGPLCQDPVTFKEFMELLYDDR
jgi:hypothetical protein